MIYKIVFPHLIYRSTVVEYVYILYNSIQFLTSVVKLLIRSTSLIRKSDFYRVLVLCFSRLWRSRSSLELNVTLHISHSNGPVICDDILITYKLHPIYTFEHNKISYDNYLEVSITTLVITYYEKPHVFLQAPYILNV